MTNLRCEDEALWIARRLFDEAPALVAVPQAARDDLASALVDALYAEFDREGQRRRWLALDIEGNPRCSHCGRMGCNPTGAAPNPPPGHFQYGLTCICTEPAPNVARVPGK